MDAWPFPDPPDTLVLTLRVIRDKIAPILFVEHDVRGNWHLFDGRETFSLSELAHMTLEESLRLESRLGEVADLPRGWQARRAALDGLWDRKAGPAPDQARQQEAFQERVEAPPGTPSIVEMLREDRNR